MGAKVMFTAVADQGGNCGPNTGDITLVFQKTITNVGAGYDNTSGVFTAPFPGVYYFTFSYQATKNYTSGLLLIKNSSVVVKAADHTGKGEYLTDNGGNSAVLELVLNDKVWVQLPANNCVLGSDNTTSFSGFLISQ